MEVPVVEVTWIEFKEKIIIDTSLVGNYIDLLNQVVNRLIQKTQFEIKIEGFSESRYSSTLPKILPPLRIVVTPTKTGDTFEAGRHVSSSFPLRRPKVIIENSQEDVISELLDSLKIENK